MPTYNVAYEASIEADSKQEALETFREIVGHGAAKPSVELGEDEPVSKGTNDVCYMLNWLGFKVYISKEQMNELVCSSLETTPLDLLLTLFGWSLEDPFIDNQFEYPALIDHFNANYEVVRRQPEPQKVVTVPYDGIHRPKRRRGRPKAQG